MIRFLLNNELVELNQVQADLTVLNYLREQRSLTGTKEGCASGDCGACTVVLAELNDDNTDLHYRAINSCISFMSPLHGKQLITVEHLTPGLPSSGNLHPVQQAIVDHHGSQCGFCTPGFVMSLFALFHNAATVNRDDVIHALSGNLCRCTGYRPIIDAALDACNQSVDDQFDKQKQNTIERLITLSNDATHGTDTLVLPRDRAELAQAIASHPNAQLVAGGTDLALESTQKLMPMPKLISVSQMASLHRIIKTDTALTIGAACPFSDIHSTLITCFPELNELVERFASVPIRNQATLGGNVANASPIGDMPPVLIALDASVVVDNGTSTKQYAIADFFAGYRQTLLADNEWIDSIVIPIKPAHESHLRAYKISKRIEDDISAVCGVFNLELDNGMVSSLSVGVGGVAATPVSCSQLTQAIVGQTWSSKDCASVGKSILQQAFSPIDDVRASANYRREVLANLWHRFWLETNAQSHSIQTRAVAHA